MKPDVLFSPALPNCFVGFSKDCFVGLSSTHLFAHKFTAFLCCFFSAAVLCAHQTGQAVFLGSSEAGPCCAAADLPVLLLLPHFTILGVLKPLCAAAAEQCLAVEPPWVLSLQSHLCFKAAAGALSTMRLLLNLAAVGLTSRKWSLSSWTQVLKIQGLSSLGSGIFCYRYGGGTGSVRFFFFSLSSFQLFYISHWC